MALMDRWYLSRWAGLSVLVAKARKQAHEQEGAGDAGEPAGDNRGGVPESGDDSAGLGVTESRSAGDKGGLGGCRGLEKPQGRDPASSLSAAGSVHATCRDTLVPLPPPDARS